MGRFKPALALLLGAASIVAGVVALSALMMGDGTPSPNTGVTTVTSLPTNGNDGGPPTAEGGVLTITGTETGTLELTSVDSDYTASGTGYTLEGRQGRITLAGQPLGIDHFVYKGFDFYLDPGDCTLTTGEINAEVGVAAATVSCPEIDDLRDTATITVEGTLGISGQLVERDDLPPVGGTITVSGAIEVTYEVIEGSWTTYAPDGIVRTPSPLQFSYGGGEPWEIGGPEISQNEEGTELWLSRLFVPPDTEISIEADECPVTFEQVAVVDPQTELRRITLDCATTLDGHGEISFEGSVIVTHFVIGH